MATIGLCIISKEYDDDIRRIIRDYANYFDQIYIQINGSGIVPASKNKIHFSQFKWTNDFAKARNAVLKEVTTDYWFWLDTDDSIENPENIENIVRTMESNSIDIMYLRYITAYNAIGEPISMLLRERIIRTALNLKWNGACHETVSLRSRLKILMDLGVTIKHADKTQAMNTASSKRNLKILLNEYAKGNRKAMTLLYIAAEYNVLKNLTGADKYYNRALIATRRKIIKYSIL
ncbi:MAG TPA: glycosyltransferase, partial [Candidatus Saccharimonadia bacterium]|nr:glycosyltransferase [Candidatus Saccharimonadia bacterium]